jgi:hypothetical protein
MLKVVMLSVVAPSNRAKVKSKFSEIEKDWPIEKKIFKNLEFN